MPRVLRIAAMSLGVFALTSSLTLAQTTPDPGQDAGHKPATGQSTHGKGKGKKAPKKGGTKKKGTHKPATTEPPK